jgi:YD repeat-containing protein
VPGDLKPLGPANLREPLTRKAERWTVAPVQRLVLVATVLGLALVSVGGAAVRIDSTDCSLNFHVRNANLDCALAIVGGTLSLDGSPAITVEVRGGQRVAFTYDLLGRVVAADVDGDRTSYAYDDSGRLLALAGANGVTRFAYDSLGRLVAAGGPPSLTETLASFARSSWMEAWSTTVTTRLAT